MKHAAVWWELVISIHYMLDSAIIPDQKITNLPLVPVLKTRLDNMCRQTFQ
jgi:hypothetical protein